MTAPSAGTAGWRDKTPATLCLNTSESPAAPVEPGTRRRAPGATTTVIIAERLLDRRQVDTETGCWLWTGDTTAQGYGSISIANKKQLVHRVAYEIWVGPIPDGLVIDHVRARGCENRICFNPAHLEPVSNRENILRGDSPQAQNARKTHCVNGHAFDEENTLWVKRPYGKDRMCRACHRESERRRREVNREKATCRYCGGFGEHFAGCRNEVA